MDLIGKSVFELIHPDDLNQIEQKIKIAFQNLQADKSEYRHRTKNGNYIWAETTGNFVIDSSGNITSLVFVTRPIEERKQYEQQLNQHIDELARLNSTKDKLFSIIAHDLRSPFSGILGLSEQLVEMEMLNAEDYKKIIQYSAPFGFTRIQHPERLI